MPTRNPTELGDHVMQNPANWFLSRELARRPPWEAQPLRIPGWDWALVSACLALVVAVWLGLAAPSSLIAAVLLALNLVRLTTCVFRAIRAGAPGLALMVLSCIIFFWFDAFVLASQPLPFSPPGGMPLGQDRFSPEEVAKGLFYCGVFEAMIFVGYSWPARGATRIKRWAASRVDASGPLAKIILCLCVPCGFLTLTIAYGFRPDAILAALVNGRAGVAGVGEHQLWMNLDEFGLFGAAYFFVLATSKGTVKRVAGVLIGAFAATPFVLSGTRHFLLFIFLPVCVANLRKLSGSFNPGRVMKWSVLFVVFFCVSCLQVTLRQGGWVQILSPETIEIYPDTSGQFSSLLYAEHLVPAGHAFFHEFAEPFFVFHWIPRQFWEGKPTMAAWEFFNSSYTRGQNFNVTPSIIGQYYMNWGVAGVVLIGLWLGFLARLVDSVNLYVQGRNRTAVIVVIGMGYAFLVASFRHYHPLYFTYEAFAMFVMLAVTKRVTHSQVRDHGIISHRFMSRLQVIGASSSK